MRKIEAWRVHSQLYLSLIQPSAKAAYYKVAAYKLITQQNESEIAWILKQKTCENNNLITIATNLYTTATNMLEKAQAVGNYTTQYYTAAFLSA
jgi:hypothetical protein